jgi:hypothetical protein
VGKLVLAAETPRAELEPSLAAPYHQCGHMNVGQPPASGMPFGVAHIIPKLGRFPTKITLCHSLITRS